MFPKKVPKFALSPALNNEGPNLGKGVYFCFYFYYFFTTGYCLGAGGVGLVFPNRLKV